MTQGNRILLSGLPKQDFSASCITPPGLLEFSPHTVLLRMQPRQVQTEPPDNPHVLRPVPGANPTVIFLERHVQHPMRLLRSEHDFRPCRGYLRAPPLLFRRRPPQSNYPPYTVPDPDHGPRLEPQTYQAGISRLAPRQLASSLQSLPAILHKHIQSPVQSCSKGSRGLSV